MTARSFNDMLKQYLPYKLLSDEIIKRDYFLSTVEKDQNWKGGPLQVPFVGANASSISFGSLTAESDISNDTFVRGEVAAYKELWGSMKFNQRDLDEHGNLEQSFLNILPDRIDVFAQSMKEALSSNLLCGGHIATVDGIGSAASGIIGVDRPEMFQIGQKLQISDSANAFLIENKDEDATAFFVKAISLDNGTITVSVTSGGDAEDMAAGVTGDTDLAVGDKIYRDSSLTSAGAEQNMFTSLPTQLLGDANDKVHGVLRASYPHLQAYNNADGAGVIAAGTVLSTIFDTQTTVRRLGRGNPSEAIMSYENFAACMKELEGDRTFSVAPGGDEKDRKGVVYGWSEIQVTGVKGSLKLVAVPEMRSDQILILDKSSMKLHSNGFIERRSAPDGKQFYESRGVNGYTYILDHRFYGDLVVSKPSNNAIITSVS